MCNSVYETEILRIDIRGGGRGGSGTYSRMIGIGVIKGRWEVDTFIDVISLTLDQRTQVTRRKNDYVSAFPRNSSFGLCQQKLTAQLTSVICIFSLYLWLCPASATAVTNCSICNTITIMVQV